MHEISIHVYPTDCDMLGHVNHATMITFLEHARWALVEPHMAARDFLRGVWSVVRHVDIGYHAQTLPGEDIVIRSGLVSVGRTSYVIRQDVRKRDGGGEGGTGTLVADAKIAFVCIGKDGRPVPVPPEWNSMFPRWRDDEELGTTSPPSSGARRPTAET